MKVVVVGAEAGGPCHPRTLRVTEPCTSAWASILSSQHQFSRAVRRRGGVSEQRRGVGQPPRRLARWCHAAPQVSGAAQRGGGGRGRGAGGLVMAFQEV